ncbi:MAG TPA: hypothetical protein VFQ57_02390 [Sphingomonas sp.]|nr:hypothetical protein [Sphingomonas sp.]
MRACPFIGVVTALMSDAAPVIQPMVVPALTSTITTAFWGTGQASLYVELRDLKDGPAAQKLADIFA